ncbi:MAG: LLM class flavin-dependent oxidoreductase, partial [Chloroflexi bacterium]|nr:LLM class flavin-dependent oxidoreductase [Chloroflexota bacterium]
ERAHKGTLCRDEIGDISPAVQVKLLRVLQELELERLGGTKTVRVDSRVVAATHVDLSAAAEQGRFRQDLFYRLNVVVLGVPPLRDRLDDLPMLAAHFLRKHGGSSPPSLSPDALEVMAAAPAYVSDDIALARDKVRWFPALVSNHVVDLINKYPKDELPEALWKYVEGREGYDYHHHAEVGSDNARFVSDEITDAFAVVGPASAQRERLEQLREVGVTQFNIYLMNGEEEDCLDAYGRDIIGEAASARA